MNVNEALQFTNRVVFEQTGQHLNDLQRAVVEGTWQRHTYDEIAHKCHVTKNHASDVGAELWQLLSEALDEDIKKSNFRSNLERIEMASLPIIIQSNNQQNNNHTFNFGMKDLNQVNQKYQQDNLNTRLQYHDLTLAPQIINFYNRETELEILTNWVLNQNTRLISVLGLSGIGKTALIKKFVDLNLTQFEIIIWRSLKFSKSLELLIDDVLTIYNQESKENIGDKLKQLLTLLTEKKSLLILDDLQNLFIPGELAGQYRPQYQDYQNWFRAIAEVPHQSSLILISQEQCLQIQSLDDGSCPIKQLELSGLENPKILENTGLKNPENWLELIHLYEGNLTYLQDIASLIKDIFDGEVTEFLTENSLIITKSIQLHLGQLFARLSLIEQQIVLALSQFENPVSKDELKEKLDLSPTEFITSLQSLQKRYLVSKSKGEQLLFTLSPVFKEYTRNYHKD